MAKRIVGYKYKDIDGNIHKTSKEYIQTNNIPDASTTVKGISRFATSEEVDTGTLGNVGVSPLEMNRWVKENILKPVIGNLTFYIKQDTGNDDIADGSQEKPFKSLLACHEYIRKNYFFCKKSAGIFIDFLSDYTELLDIINLNPITNNTISLYNYVCIRNTNPYNVKLTNIFLNTGAHTLFENITFIGNNKSTYPIIDTHTAWCTLRDITFDLINDNYRDALKSRYYANLNIYNTTFKNSKNISGSLFICYGNSAINFLEGSTTITDNLTVNNFMSVASNSFINIHTSVNFSGSITGKKYLCKQDGKIYTNGRGESILLGTIEGTKETGGEIY